MARPIYFLVLQGATSKAIRPASGGGVSDRYDVFLCPEIEDYCLDHGQ